MARVGAFISPPSWDQVCCCWSTSQPHILSCRLDFKDPLAVPACMLILQQKLLDNASRKPFPVWLNADVLTGPGGLQSKFDAGKFIAECSLFLSQWPLAMLSLGWTTTFQQVNIEPYSDSMIEQMIKLCDQHHLRCVTFPIRSSLVASSVGPLHRLLSHSRDFSLTLWNSKHDSELADTQFVNTWVKQETSALIPFSASRQLFVDLFRRCEDSASPPRFRILQQGPFASVTCHIVPGKRQYSTNVQKLIDENWAKLTQDKSKLLFDGTVFSLLGVESYPPSSTIPTSSSPSELVVTSIQSPANQFHLKVDVQESSYRAAITTNSAAQISKGLTERADGLGVCSVTITSDGFVILGERSSRLAEGSSMWHVVPAGNLDLVSPIDTILKELHEELNVSDKANVEQLYCMGLGEVVATCKPEYLMLMRLSLSSIQVSQLMATASDRDEHKHIEFVPVSQLRKFIQEHNVVPIGLAALEVFIFLSSQS